MDEKNRDLLEEITALALRVGADVVGVAPIERFRDFPKQQNPMYIMPEAKSMIVLGHRTMRGSLRGAEEGTFFSHYPTMGVGYVKKDIVPMTARTVCCFIEDLGKEAMPIGDHFAWAAAEDDGTMKKRHSVPVREGLPAPDIRFSLTDCAFLAGLGEIGYSGQLLNPRYGPRLIFGCVLTELELPGTPIVPPGTLCKRCMKCADECPGGCISKTETQTMHLGGYTFEIGKFDAARCAVACTGSEITEDGSYAPTKHSPFFSKPGATPPFTNSGNICAGHGCLRACMMELEDQKRITNLFDVPFRRHPEWEVDWEGYRSGRLVNDTQLPNAAAPQVKRNINDIDE